MDSGTLGLASALAELGIYELADLVEMARAGGLHEMIVHVVAIDQGQLEQRLEQAVRIHKLAADRRAALLSQAEARAAAAERLQRQAEARHTSLPQKPIMPSVQVQQVSSTVSGVFEERSHSDTYPHGGSGQCRHTGTVFGDCSSR